MKRFVFSALMSFFFIGSYAQRVSVSDLLYLRTVGNGEFKVTAESKGYLSYDTIRGEGKAIYCFSTSKEDPEFAVRFLQHFVGKTKMGIYYISSDMSDMLVFNSQLTSKGFKFVDRVPKSETMLDRYKKGELTAYVGTVWSKNRKGESKQNYHLFIINE